MSICDYTSDISNLNNSIANLKSQIDTISDYTNDINGIKKLISDIQSQNDTLTSGTNNSITEINEKLLT